MYDNIGLKLRAVSPGNSPPPPEEKIGVDLCYSSPATDLVALEVTAWGQAVNYNVVRDSQSKKRYNDLGGQTVKDNVVRDEPIRECHNWTRGFMECRR